MGKATKLPRKQRRKQERQLKKAKKREFFSRKKLTDANVVKEVIKEVKPVKQAKPVLPKPQKKKKKSVDPIAIRKRQLLSANELEDRNIKKLEKKLHLNKRKSKSIPKSFVDDGLDYILEACDRDKIKNVKDDDDDDDEFNDLFGGASDSDQDEKDSIENAKPTQEMLNEHSDEDNELEETFDEDQEMDSSGEEVSVASEKVSPSKKRKSTLKVGDDDVDDNDDQKINNEKQPKKVRWQVDEKSDGSSAEESEENEEPIECKEPESTMWEDIYGRTRDREGNVVKNETKYVPPAKRGDPSPNETLSRLKKRLQGSLNRLSDANIQPISSQIEDLYRNHSRNDVNETLSNLLSEALIQPTLTPERLVQEHAMLLALLHANVGTEIGAHVLQRVVETFHSLYEKGLDERKEIHNALLLLCHMCSFKVVGCSLIFDILQLLTERFNEMDVELILLIFRSVGFHLRKDDPTNLKETIFNIQTKANKAASTEGSRIKFMLETLAAIRNNNMYKIPNYDPSHVEHLRKLLRGIIRKGNSVTELKISLKDLLDVEKKGRWWIVGSAWQNEIESSQKSEKLADAVDEKILNIAKRQRMNTDIRRSIFCILMTAEDYIDCFEKLLRLSLKSQQEREIVVVILDCCMNEKQFNPYYAYIAEKFCAADRKYRMAFQFACWDQFKELKSMKKIQVTNLAHFLSHLLITHSLSLSVLKVLRFADMDKPLVKFLQQLLLVLLLHDNEEAMCNAFKRIHSAKDFHLLRKSLWLFIHHFMLKEIKDAMSVEKLKDRVNKIDHFLSS